MTDKIINVGFSYEEAKTSTELFETYVNEHRDEIEALRLIYNQESGKLTRPIIDDLAKHLQSHIPGFNVGRLWGDYALLNPKKVKPLNKELMAATNLIQLVRFAYKKIESLYSLKSLVAQRFELWCGQAQREISSEQKEVFRKIAHYIAQNGGCDFDSLLAAVPEMIRGLRPYFSSKQAANDALYSLNEFILKVA